MRIIIHMRAVAVATGLLSTLPLIPLTAPAASSEYRLEALEQRLPIGKEVTLAVRLVHAPTGKPVTEAVIFRTRLDMSPAGMGDMAETLTPLASSEPGVWRYTTKLTMAGDWTVTVQAKVPGETETVRASAIVTGFEQPGATPHTYGR
jgi:YtkA-like